MKKILLILVLLVSGVSFSNAQSSLLSPADGSYFDLDGDALDSLDISWTSDTLTAPTYMVLVDEVSGGLANPITIIPSIDTMTSISYGAVDQLLISNGYSEGDTANLIWTVIAISGSDTSMAADTFDFNIVKGIVLYPFANLSIANGSVELLNGPASAMVDFVWESANPSATYEWMIDLVGNNFASPIAQGMTGNGGMDTTLSLSYDSLNTLLAGQLVNIGDTLDLVWAVEASSNTDAIMSNEFDLALVRSVPFGSYNTLNPASFSYTEINGQGSSTLTFNWENASSVVNPSYTFSLDISSGDFTNAWITMNVGGDTSLDISYSYLNSLMINNGIALGDTAELHWMVEADNGNYSLYSNTDTLNLIQGVTIDMFNLVEPADNDVVALNGTNASQLDFVWNSAGANTDYTVYLYPAGSNAANSVLEMASNASGSDTTMVVDYTDLNMMLDTLGHNYGDTIDFEWDVRVVGQGDTAWSSGENMLSLIRGFIFGNPSLNSPSNSTNLDVDGKANSTLTFSWDPSGDTIPEYELLLDYSFGNFNNPLLAVSTSDTFATMSFDTLRDILVSQGFPLNGTLLAKWKVNAVAPGYVKGSSSRNLTLKRGIVLDDFNLSSPAAGDSITIEGDGLINVELSWENSGFFADYRVYIISPLNDTLITIPTGPNQDSLLLSYQDINDLLEANNVPIGSTVPISWDVQAYSNSDSLGTSLGSRIVNITRGVVIRDYHLLTPTNNGTLNFYGNSSKTLDFTWSDGGTGVTYELLIDSAGNDYSTPIYYSYVASDTFLNMSYLQLENILETLGLAVGSSLDLIWTVKGNNSIDTVTEASNMFTLTRDHLISPFDLVSPSSGTAVTVQGRSDNTLAASWESSSITAPLNQFVVDIAGGNYANPLVVLDADMGGTDSTRTLEYGLLDGFLEGAGIAINSSFPLQWTARTIVQDDTIFATSSNNITLTRGSVMYPFDLNKPTHNKGVVVEGVNTDMYSFYWHPSNDTLTTYDFYMDTADGSFGSPVLMASGLNDTSYTTDMQTLEQIVLSQNISINAYGSFDWYVVANTGGDQLESVDTNRVHLTRGNVVYPFELISPRNGTLFYIEGVGKDQFVFRWHIVSPNGEPVYDWLIDLPGNNFTAPILTVGSDNNGLDTSITLNYGQVDDLLDQAGIGIGDTLIAIWSARANAGFTNLLANNNPYFLTLVRGEVIRPFNLTGPMDNTTEHITGSAARRFEAGWSNAGAANVTYEWVLDAPGGDFSNPMATISSSSGGLDTMLSTGYVNIENTLIAQGLNIGDTLDAIWDVKATNPAGFAFSENGPFNVKLIRGSVIKPFSLNNPSNNTRVVVEGNASTNVLIDWQAAGNGAYQYNWIFDLPGGNFSPQLGDLLSDNGGADNALNIDYAGLDNLLASLGLSLGDSIDLDWTVRATEGTDAVNANNTHSIRFIRGGLTVPFSLLGPVDGTTLSIPGNSTQNLTFSWENADYQGNLNVLDYTWLLDLNTGNFSNPQMSSLSDNNGKDISIVIPYQDIYNVLSANSVALGESLKMKWIVKTGAAGSEQFAIGQNAITFIRNENVGLEENVMKVNKLFPNPSNGLVNIEISSPVNEMVEIEIIDIIGNVVYSSSRQLNNGLNFIMVDGSALSSGLYMIKANSEHLQFEERLTITK